MTFEIKEIIFPANPLLEVEIMQKKNSASYE